MITWDFASGVRDTKQPPGFGIHLTGQQRPMRQSGASSGSVPGVQWHPPTGLLLWWDLRWVPHCSAFSVYCPFPEPVPPAFPFLLELADIFPMYLCFVLVKQTWFLFCTTKNPDWCTCWVTVPVILHRTDIIPTRSRDRVYMNQCSHNWVVAHFLLDS